MTQTVGAGVLTMDELAASIGNVTPLAYSMGVSFEDLGGYIAYMTTQGATASEATTQLNAMMSALLTPNAAMADAFQLVGFETGQAAIEAYGLAGAYEILGGALTEEQLGNAVGRIEGLKGALQLATPEAENFMDAFTGGTAAASENVSAFGTALMDTFSPQTAAQVSEQLNTMSAGVRDLETGLGSLTSIPVMNQLQESAMNMAVSFDTAKNSTMGYTEAARAIQRESPAAQFALLKSEIQGLAIQVGTALLPALTELFTQLQPVISSVVEWVSANPELVAQIGIAVVAFGALMAVLIPLGMAITALGTVITAFGAVVAFALSPVGLIILGLIAVGALLYYAWSENFLGIQNAVNSAIDIMLPKISEFYLYISDTAIPAISLAIDAAIASFNALRDRINTIWSAVSTAINAFKGNIIGVFEAIYTPIAQVESIINAVAEALSGIDLGVLGDVISAGGGVLSNIPGLASGTPWTGSMPRNAAAGIVHGQEAVIPTGGMVARVIPSPSGLQVQTRGGGGGGLVINGDIYVSGVENIDQLYEQLAQEGRRRSVAMGNF